MCLHCFSLAFFLVWLNINVSIPNQSSVLKYLNRFCFFFKLRNQTSNRMDEIFRVIVIQYRDALSFNLDHRIYRIPRFEQSCISDMPNGNYVYWSFLTVVIHQKVNIKSGFLDKIQKYTYEKWDIFTKSILNLVVFSLANYFA